MKTIIENNTDLTKQEILIGIREVLSCIVKDCTVEINNKSYILNISQKSDERHIKIENYQVSPTSKEYLHKLSSELAAQLIENIDLQEKNKAKQEQILNLEKKNRKLKDKNRKLKKHKKNTLDEEIIPTFIGRGESLKDAIKKKDINQTVELSSWFEKQSLKDEIKHLKKEIADKNKLLLNNFDKVNNYARLEGENTHFKQQIKKLEKEKNQIITEVKEMINANENFYSINIQAINKFLEKHD